MDQWFASAFGSFASALLRSGLWLLVVYVLAGTRSLGAFASRVGLLKRPSLAGWFSAWAGAGIGLLELFFISRGLERQNDRAAEMVDSGGSSLALYVLSTVIIAPFYEEIVMRGVIYRAFRGSYSIPASTVLVCLVVAYFHWGLAVQPLFFVDVLVASTMLCIIRERTGSTWNCILFHAAHNAAVSMRWPIYVVAMLLLLPICGPWKASASKDESNSEDKP